MANTSVQTTMDTLRQTVDANLATVTELLAPNAYLTLLKIRHLLVPYDLSGKWVKSPAGHLTKE